MKTKPSAEPIIGTTGKLVDLFKEKLTQKEWNALCTVHRMAKKLDVQILFRYDKSIDVIAGNCSQIIDESVFLNREKK